MLTFFLVMQISQSALSVLKVYSALKESKKEEVPWKSSQRKTQTLDCRLQNGGEIQSSGSV